MAIKDLAPWGWSKRKLSPLMEEGNPFTALQRQMNTLLEDFMSGTGFEPVFSRSFAPRVNVSEDNEKIYISAEIPGLNQNDVELTLTREALTLRGEKKEEFEEREGRHRYHIERTFGSFQRVIPLNAEVDEDKVDAVFKDGVLSVTLTKTAEAQRKSKKIPIRT